MWPPLTLGAVVVEACILADDVAIARRRYEATGDRRDGRAVATLATELQRLLGALGFAPTDQIGLAIG